MGADVERRFMILILKDDLGNTSTVIVVVISVTQIGKEEGRNVEDIGS
ncbi:MAG: hypothetical protein WA364_00565 [Candidatus Nitrosopolaris sp.]